MVRILDELTNFLEFKGIVVTDVDSFLTTETDRLMLFEEPCEAKKFSYLDGSRSGEFNFSLRAKDTSLVDAIALLTRAEEILDVPTFFQVDNFILKTINIVQTSHPVSRDAKNNLIYASDFTLSYYIEKD